MLKFIIPNESHKSQWEEIIAEWDDTRKRPRILFQPSFEEFIKRIGQLSQWDDKEKQVAEIPDPSHFMKLGEEAFIKNVAEKLRAEMSPREKIMWLQGYLLAVTQYRKR